MKTRTLLALLVVISLLATTACAGATPPPPSSAQPPLGSAQPLPGSAQPPLGTATATPLPPSPTPPAPSATPPPAAAAPADLPPEPRPVKFQTADGQATLDGLHYPAATKGAPVVVLMHWGNSDQAAWVEIAYWLQNRGLGGKSPNPDQIPWLDPSWFPPVPQGLSLNVLTFTFRGCAASGCPKDTPRTWQIDANSVMKAAAELEDVDSQKVVAAGASLGADGAVDGCAWLNTASEKGHCPGAFSLSPGGYLGVPYAEAVKQLQAGQPPPPVWCLYARLDSPANLACKSALGSAYRAVAFPSVPHGMMLIAPKVEPDTLQLMLDWLKASLGL